MAIIFRVKIYVITPQFNYNNTYGIQRTSKYQKYLLHQQLISSHDTEYHWLSCSTTLFKHEENLFQDYKACN